MVITEGKILGSP